MAIGSDKLSDWICQKMLDTYEHEMKYKALIDKYDNSDEEIVLCFRDLFGEVWQI